MAGTFSDYLESQVAEHLWGSSGFTPTTAHWVALFSTASGLETGNSTAEIAVANGYGRVKYNNDSTGWPANNPKLNANVVTFPVATGTGWGVVTHMALVDSSATTGPNYYCWSDLLTSKTIDGGDTASFSTGSLSIGLD